MRTLIIKPVTLMDKPTNTLRRESPAHRTIRHDKPSKHRNNIPTTRRKHTKTRGLSKRRKTRNEEIKGMKRQIRREHNKAGDKRTTRMHNNTGNATLDRKRRHGGREDTWKEMGLQRWVALQI
jgi:hypothetical protein